MFGATAHLPSAEVAIRAHFDASFLSQVSPAALNQALEAVGAMVQGAGPVRPASIEVDRTRDLVAIVSRAGGTPTATASLAVDGRGLISGLLFRPLVAAAATNWHEIDAAVAGASPES